MPKAARSARASAKAADTAELDPRFAAIEAAFRRDPDVTSGKMMAAASRSGSTHQASVGRMCATGRRDFELAAGRASRVVMRPVADDITT